MKPTIYRSVYEGVFFPNTVTFSLQNIIKKMQLKKVASSDCLVIFKMQLCK